jgi:hypothetical protein
MVPPALRSLVGHSRYLPAVPLTASWTYLTKVGSCVGNHRGPGRTTAGGSQSTQLLTSIPRRFKTAGAQPCRCTGESRLTAASSAQSSGRRPGPLGSVLGSSAHVRSTTVSTTFFAALPRATGWPVLRSGVHAVSSRRGAPSNKRMQLTKLRAAPVLQAEVPPCAPAGQLGGGTASQLIRSARWTRGGARRRG